MSNRAARPPALSVVVPLWNGAAWIENCLRALQRSIHRSGATVEVIVVDNASTDDGAERARGVGGARVLANAHNLGFAGGCNVGMRIASAELIALLNQDAEVAPDWVQSLLQGITAPGITGCLIYRTSPNAPQPADPIIEHAGGVIDPTLGLTRHLLRDERLSPPAVAGTLAAGAAPDFVTGAALVVHRSVLNEIGPLDEEFWPGYYEDVDLCVRARAAGFEIGVLPAAVVHHAGHASFGDGPRARWARLRGRLRFCAKHLPPERFLQEFLPAEQAHRPAVLAGDRAGAIARAYIEVAAGLPELWAGRADPAQIQRATSALAALYAPRAWLLPAEADETLPAETVLARTQPVLTGSRVETLPLVGPLLRRMRRAAHQLVIFYLRQRQDELSARVQQQQAQIEALRAQLSGATQPDTTGDDDGAEDRDNAGGNNGDNKGDGIAPQPHGDRAT